MKNPANEIARLAYQEDITVESVMDEAEKAVFAMSERRIHHDIQPIRSVLSDYYDHMDEMARRLVHEGGGGLDPTFGVGEAIVVKDESALVVVNV